MRKVFIIGIGAGNPDYITVQAINALNEVDVFFVMDKGREKEDLIRLRKDICERYITPAIAKAGWDKHKWRREFGFTPREWRVLRTPVGIQRALEAMPYHVGH